jgi:hypothetical protein
MNFLYDVERDKDQKIQNKKEVVDNYIFLINE